jgi:uncharacterized Zn-finger protein
MADILVRYGTVQEELQGPSGPNEPEKNSSYVCKICNQSYTRVDHLSRHYRSRKCSCKKAHICV